MTFKTLPVAVVGQSYQSRSVPLSAQSTENLYSEFNADARTQTALQNFPGLIRRVTQSGADRGSHVFQNYLYKVSSTTLYRVNANWTTTSIGTIAGTDRCIFADDGTYMVITTGDTAYTYDGVTLASIADADLETPSSVTMLNSQFIFDGNGQRWVSSTPDDPTDIPAENYAEAESAGDNLVRVYAFTQILYLFGEKTIEPWYNSGIGSPPFDRVEGGIIQKGLIALHSVANTDQFIYFLGDDKNFYQLFQYQTNKISTPAMVNTFEGADVSDAIGMAMSLEGQNFYIVTLPTLNKTFFYSEQMKMWGQLSHGVDGERHLINSYQFCYGKRLITDYRNGNVLEFDLDTFENDSEVQIRQRDTSPINGIALNLPGQRLMMSRFELLMQVGVGLATGQGSDPVIMFSISIDGGQTFSGEGVGFISPGASGDYLKKVEWYHMCSFENAVIRIRVSDPVFISIHAAAIDVDLAGW